MVFYSFILTLQPNIPKTYAYCSFDYSNVNGKIGLDVDDLRWSTDYNIWCTIRRKILSDCESALEKDFDAL